MLPPPAQDATVHAPILPTYAPAAALTADGSHCFQRSFFGPPDGAGAGDPDPGVPSVPGLAPGEPSPEPHPMAMNTTVRSTAPRL